MTERERYILELRFGLVDGYRRTLGEVVLNKRCASCATHVIEPLEGFS